MHFQLQNLLQEKRYTWLITGIAGFIGSHLLHALLLLNQKVIGIDNFLTGRQKNIDDVLQSIPAKYKKNFKMIRADIRSVKACSQAVSGVDYILHQAALSSVPWSMKDPRLTHSINVSGFLNMLEAAKKAKVKRFIYASSSAVYGNSTHLPLKEENLGELLSPYAVSKYEGELNAQMFSKCYGIETIGLRYFNVFGPRQDPNGAYAAVIPLWILGLLKKKTIYVNGNGNITRDFVYVDNVVWANILAALTSNKQAINKVYNIASGTSVSLNSLLKMCQNCANSVGSVIYREYREGDIKHSAANIDKSYKLIKYRPMVSVKKGLQLTWDWYEKQLTKKSN